MKKTMTKPTNIKDDAETLNASFAAFDGLTAEFDRQLQEMETMEPGIDTDIDRIEREGQEALVEDAIESAETLDDLDA
jgi:hypothetical protein